MQEPSSPRWSITLKLVLVLLAVSLPPMVGTAYYNLLGSLNTVQAQEQENLELLAVSLASRLDQLITDTQRIAGILAADNEVISFLSHTGKDRARYAASTNATLHSIADTVEGVAHAYLMDRDGVFVAATNPKVQGRNYARREYFQRAWSGETFVSELIFGTTSGEPGIYFSRPVQGSSGKILGVALVKLKAEAVTDIMDRFDSQRRGDTWLLEKNGILLHHRNAALRFHSLTALPPDQADQIMNVVSYPVEHIKSLGLEALERTLAGHPQGGHARFLSPLDQQPLVLGFAPMSGEHWTVGVAKPEAQFVAPLSKLFWDAMLSIGAVAILTLIFAVMFGRAIGRPLTLLTRAAGLLHGGTLALGRDPFDRAQLGLASLVQRRDEIGNLARVFEDMACQVHHREEHLDTLVQTRTAELTDKNAQLETAQRRILAELNVARSLQLSLLPTLFPVAQGYDLYARTIPAREVGGDFYDYFLLDRDRIGLVVADVSGKGVPAAFFMVVARTLMQNYAPRYLAPGEFLSRVNDVLCAENPLELFVTAFYGVLDCHTRRLRYSNGGHNPPLRLQSNGCLTFLEPTGDMALGIQAGETYAEREIALEPSDTLVLYTDGITEAFDPNEQEYGEQRLIRAVKASQNRTARELVDHLVEDVDQFAAGAEPSDDLTCLVLGLVPNSTPKAGVPPAEVQLSEHLSLCIPAQLAAIQEVTDAVETFAEAHGLDEADLFNLNLCLDELLTNSISYGYADPSGQEIHIDLRIAKGSLTLVIEDQGRPFDPFSQVPPPDLAASLDERAIGGLGIHLVRQFMDECHYEHKNGHNRVELRKHLEIH